MSVDVEIYMNNVIKFFRDNPNDLLNLVPKSKEEEFYHKVREVAMKNLENGDEVGLTQVQIIDICVEINNPSIKKFDIDHAHLFMKTKIGLFCLN
jgi:hypothetical protein